MNFIGLERTWLRSFLYTVLSLSGPSCCFRKESNTETIILVSSVSLKTMKKTGTANTLTILGVAVASEIQDHFGYLVFFGKQSAT